MHFHDADLNLVYLLFALGLVEWSWIWLSGPLNCLYPFPMFGSRMRNWY